MLITDFGEFMDKLELLPVALQKRVQNDIQTISGFEAADFHNSEISTRIYIFVNDDWIYSFSLLKQIPKAEVKVKEFCRPEIQVLNTIEKRLEEKKHEQNTATKERK